MIPARCTAQLPKAYGPALLDPPLVGGPRVDAIQEGGEVRELLEPVEHAPRLDHEGELDVGRREVAAYEELATREQPVEPAEVRVELARDARLEGRSGLAEPPGVELQHHGQHRRALGVVHELQVADAVRRERIGRSEPPLPVLSHHVLEDRPRLDHDGLAVAQHRRLAERVDLLQRLRREVRLRVALVVLDLVREAQLLEQPEDALGAGVVEVVDFEHGFSSGGAGHATTGASAADRTTPSVRVEHVHWLDR